jgi:soluble lytic murein transglycosylase
VPNMRFDQDSLTAEEVERLLTWRPARRAFALIQVGEYRLAELELLLIAREQDVELRRALRHVARRVGLPELAARLGHYASFKREQTSWVYADLYPRMPYEPKGGFLIDRALVNAIARKESFFRPELTNGIGATGLMQVTAAAADFVVKKGYIAPYGRVRDLTKPELNIAYAETYLAYLLGTKIVDGDVVNLLVAYNAGIGNAKKWKARARSGGDQLLFMESLPSRETRFYVDQVLRSLLIYRLKFKQSRDDFLAFTEGGTLPYVSQDRAGVSKF